MRDYSTARTIFSILEFVAWTAVVIGIVVAFMGASAGGYYSRSAAGLAGAIPGLVLSFLGLIGAAFVQNCRAGVDTAEMTGKMLKISEQQLQLARASAGYATSSGATRSVASKDSASASFGTGSGERTALSADFDGPDGVGREPKMPSIEYKGESILTTQLGVFIGDEQFETVEAAKKHIDEKEAADEAWTSNEHFEAKAAEIMRKYPSI